MKTLIMILFLITLSTNVYSSISECFEKETIDRIDCLQREIMSTMMLSYLMKILLMKKRCLHQHL